MWLYVTKSSYHPAKFDCQEYCDSADIMILVCHVIIQEYLIKRLFNFMGRSESSWVTILPGLVAEGTVVVGK